MKKLFLSLVLISALSASAAKKFYFSSSGSYSNTGTSSASPWKNLSKIDSLLLTAGDSIFFKCGDTLRGGFKIKYSGTSANPIVFTSYGTGNKPIISGAEKVGTWTNNNGIYSLNTSYNVNNFFANNKEQILARTPNEGTYLTLDSAQKTYLKDAGIPQSDNYWSNASICVHSSQWCWEKTTVKSQLSGKVTFNNPLILVSLNNYGYFFYNKLEALDADKEWYNDTTNNVLYFKPAGGSNPNNLLCEITVRNYGAQGINNASYITFSNLIFDKQYQAGIHISSNYNKNFKINNCEFYRQYNHGVQSYGKYHEISNSTFREVDGHGVDVNSGAGVKIHHNTFRNIGPFRNSGIGGETNLSAIAINFADSCNIDHNNIDSTGYCGISADGGYNLVEKNIVKHAMLLNNDGAAIKSFGINSHHSTFRNNFVSNSSGSTEGCFKADFLTPGIYFDFEVNNCTVSENTIYNQSSKGIFQNSGNENNTLYKNVIFGGDQGIDLNGNPIKTTAITGYTIKKNVVIALDANDVLLRQVDQYGLYNYGNLDSNYLFQAYDTSKTCMRPVSANQTNYYGFKQYQALNGLDAHSKQSFVHWASGTNNYRLFMNQSDNVATVSLGDSLYLTLDNVEKCGSIQLQPYTSVVLINTLDFCTITSVKEAVSEYFNIYPNPAYDFLSINLFDNAIPSTYYILSTSGQILTEGTCNGQNVDISSLTPGVYFVRVVNERSSSAKTFVIKR